MSYNVGDKVRSTSRWTKGEIGTIWQITDCCVHVKFGSGSKVHFEKYYFTPFHHSQSGVGMLSKVTTE